MAREIINLEDAVVTGIYSNGGIVHATISNESNGKTFTNKWTLWFKDTSHGLTVGDIVNISGFPSMKVSDPFVGNDGVERRSVERSVNSPRVTTKVSAIQEQPNADTPF